MVRDSSPAWKVEAARAREEERLVLPKKETVGVLLEGALLLAVAMVPEICFEQGF